MDFNMKRSLLAAAGHGGRVVVFAIQKNEIPSQLSFKGHSGWISSCCFVNPSKSQEKNFLLTSSNDGRVSLWDLSKECTIEAKPLEVFSTDSLHNGGIFKMHEKDLRVVTASKDGTVSYSQLTETEIKEIHQFNKHEGVVKYVQLRDSNVFASCGNDCTIRIFDVRENPSSLHNMVIENAHESPINSAQWHPTNEFEVMSSSFDAHTKIWDLRNPSKPVSCMVAHGKKDPKRNAIHIPAYFCKGNSVLATGNSSSLISLFNPAKGNDAVSGCDIGSQPSCIKTFGEDLNMAVVASGSGNIRFLSPIWKIKN
eukprot:c1733_g1_i1.p1 GENE.c1733_g1_i1~~c1733_g1_i1.p1  ORF type:complete len:311 (+),score=91.05 c1733_g1_i1:54-986(+)